MTSFGTPFPLARKAFPSKAFEAGRSEDESGLGDSRKRLEDLGEVQKLVQVGRFGIRVRRWDTVYCR